jgi:methanethiol S-methyltransferase
MRKFSYTLYSLLCYLVFHAAVVWGIAFTGSFVPASLRAAPMPMVPALLTNLALLGLFGVQHSVMARTGFKRWWTRLVPAPIERSTYVLLASLSLMLLFWQWRPLPGTFWAVEQPAGRLLLWGLFGLGWTLVAVSTLLIDYFALFGLRQIWNYWRAREPEATPFRTPLLYRLVRHPMMLGFLVAFWATPRMSGGHLLFAIGMTAYILIGTIFEERDLLQAFGATYRAYQGRVPMLIPRLWPRPAQPARVPLRSETES